jgi:hypothetical protein
MVKQLFLKTQDATGMVSKRYCKVENGKFEMKGKITEPSFYSIQLEGAQVKIFLS